jgi:hypothetical protein
MEESQNWLKMKKPPTALAGGGLGAAYLEKPVRQATFPARALVTLIRIAGIDIAMQATNEKPDLATAACMTLIAVKQRSQERVKEAGYYACRHSKSAFQPICSVTNPSSGRFS